MRRGVVSGVLLVLMLSMLGLVPASAALGRPGVGEVAATPLDGEDIDLGLLGTDGAVYAVTQDPDTGGTIVSRVAANGSVDSGTASLTATFRVVEASDGTLWAPLAEESALGETSNGALAGFDPTTLIGPVVPITPSDAVPGFNAPAAADGDGRVWAQAFVDSRLYAVAAGVDEPFVSVETQLDQIASDVDPTVTNPILHGPDGRMWLLGVDAERLIPVGLRARVTSVDASGVVVDVAPEGHLVGSAWLTEAAGQVWTVVIDESDGTLAALGVDPSGATQLLPTSLSAVTGYSGSRPVTDPRGRLWFVGADDEALVVAEVDARRGQVEQHPSGLQVLDGVVTSVVATAGGAIVAGIDADGNLAFARVGTRHRVVTTDLQPFTNSDSQDRYPVVSDGSNGAWAQAVDADGNLVVVHVGTRGVDTSPTGLSPAARVISVGPDGNLWTQATDSNGQLVLVSVSPQGQLTTYPTGYEPPALPLVSGVGPVSDGEGNLWFKAQDEDNAPVLVRVTATRGRR